MADWLSKHGLVTGNKPTGGSSAVKLTMKEKMQVELDYQRAVNKNGGEPVVRKGAYSSNGKQMVKSWSKDGWCTPKLSGMSLLDKPINLDQSGMDAESVIEVLQKAFDAGDLDKEIKDIEASAKERAEKAASRKAENAKKQ